MVDKKDNGNKRENYFPEVFILGLFIYLGLAAVDIKVNINVTDKPIIVNAESAEAVRNVERQKEH